MGEWHRWVQRALGVCIALVLGACPGDLTGEFGDGGVELKDAETILAESCGTMGCHDDSTQAQAGLDLLSPGVESRVVDVNAIGLGCNDRILVVAGDPNTSYLLEKVLNIPGICDNQMPPVGSLPADEIEVLRQWILDLGDPSTALVDGG